MIQAIRSVFYSLLLAGLLFLPGNAEAVFINPYSCSVSTTAVNFGIYWADVALNSTGTVTVTCSPFATTVVHLDKGKNVLTGFTTRKMASGANTIAYNLYTSATHVNVWGDGTNGSFTMTGSNLTIYGQMPAGQVVAPGTYVDTVLVTIIW